MNKTDKTPNTVTDEPFVSAVVKLSAQEESILSIDVGPHLAKQAGLSAPLKKGQVLKYLLRTIQTGPDLSDDQKAIVRDIVAKDKQSRKHRNKRTKKETV